MNTWIDLHALWRIVVVGLLAGAGLPAVFALGLRLLARSDSRQPVAAGAGDGPDAPAEITAGTGGVAAAALCFAVVLAGIGYGIYLIVNGS